MKIGDRVKVISNGSSLIDREGVIQNLRFEDGISVLLDEDKHKTGADWVRYVRICEWTGGMVREITGPRFY